MTSKVNYEIVLLKSNEFIIISWNILKLYHKNNEKKKKQGGKNVIIRITKLNEISIL